MRKNPELEPLRQSVVVYNLVLATPATALVPNFNSFAVPLDQSVTWRGGTCYMGNIQSSIYHRPGIHPKFHHTHTDKTTLQTREDTPASPCGVDTTRGATVTGYKPSFDWRKARRQGLLPTVGGILGSHWTAIARLKLAAPRQKGAVPPRSAILIGCMGIRNHPKSSPQLAHQARKEKTKRDQL